MNRWSDYLSRIELAAHAAPASLLRLLIQELRTALDDEMPEDCAEYGRMLLLKLDHLLTQQQVRARQQAVPGYLAPTLVIRDAPRRRAP